MLHVLGLQEFAPHIALASILLLLCAFASEKWPPEVVAISGMAFFLLCGMVDTAGMLGALSNNAPWTIIAMFILSSALMRTGVLDGVGRLLRGLTRYGQGVVLIVFILFNIVASAFFNNIPQVVMMIPVTIMLARACGMAPSRLLMPLSFATILGGTLALIGASTNLVVDGIVRGAGLPGFSMFEITPLGILVAIAGTIYLTIAGRFFIPHRDTVTTLLDTKSQPHFLVEVFVPMGSPLIGRNPLDSSMLQGPERRVVDVIRGGLSLRRDMPSVRLTAGDIIVMKSDVANVMTMRDRKGVEISAPDEPLQAEVLGEEPALQPVAVRGDTLAEAIVGPSSRLIGRTLRQERLRRRFGVYPIAVHRQGENLEGRLEEVKLRVGDTLLLEGAPEDLQKVAADADLINLSPSGEKGFRPDKALVATLTLAGVVLLSALNIIPIAGAAWIGVAFVLLTRCIDSDEAIQSVEWSVILLLYSMLTIGSGLEQTGAIEVIVNFAEPYLIGMSPIVVLALIYVVSSLMTEIVTANAVAVVVTPLAIALAIQLGHDPRPFAVAVMFAASASFATPVGYQTNTLVYSAGGYRFLDFVKVGLPLNVICGIVTILFLPLIWKL
jgi:di/tricarboxylate transporter